VTAFCCRVTMGMCADPREFEARTVVAERAAPEEAPALGSERPDLAAQTQTASTDMMPNPPAASNHFCQLSPGSSNSVLMMSRVAI
jgi:hypothetical protein